MSIMGMEKAGKSYSVRPNEQITINILLIVNYPLRFIQVLVVIS